MTDETSWTSWSDEIVDGVARWHARRGRGDDGAALARVRALVAAAGEIPVLGAPRVDRALGALLGMAVGDALGTTLEFTRSPAVASGQRLAGPHREITGGGPFRVVPGQITDDTHMACCLAGAIADGVPIDRAALARAYAAWSRVTFDIGSMTRGAIDGLERGDLDGGRRAWEARGADAAPNGSLMRTAPVGALLAARPADRRRAAFDDSALTHFDPRCQLACAAFDAAIAEAVTGADDALAMVAAAERELAEAAGDLRARHPDLAVKIARGRDDLLADLAAARAPDPGFAAAGLDPEGGFVRTAFRLAFWALVHADGVDDGLVDVVNRGGDADTNGAIAGALLGARFGVAAIPARWRRPVLFAEPPGPFATVYHPVALVDALARVHPGP